MRRLSADHIGQFSRFVLVGAANTAFSYAVYASGLFLGLSYQLASLFGVYGLSLFVALVNVGFAVAALGPPQLSASTFAMATAGQA